MSKVGHRYFGKTPVAVENKDAWDRHDPAQSWSDGGEVKAILGEAMSKLERALSSQATMATVEFAESAEAALRAENGEVLMGLRMYSDASYFVVTVPLRKVIMAALAELKPILAGDPEAQAALSALVSMGRQLADLVPVKPPALPSRSAPVGAAPMTQSRQAGRVSS